jgi:hypothetical protein
VVVGIDRLTEQLEDALLDASVPVLLVGRC